MRNLTVITFFACLTIGFLHVWYPMLIPNRLSSELNHLDFVTINIVRMREDFAEALQDNPTCERLLARAHVAKALESCDNAMFAVPEEIDDFSAAIRLDPTYARAYIYRGFAVRIHPQPGSREKQLKQVIADFETVIRLNPKSRHAELAYEMLASEYRYLRQPQKAIEVCSMAVSNLSASDARYLYHFRSSLYGGLGEHQKEIDDYEMAKRIERKEYWADRWSEWVWKLRWLDRLLLVFLPLWLWCGRRFGHGRALAP